MWYLCLSILCWTTWNSFQYSSAHMRSSTCIVNKFSRYVSSTWNITCSLGWSTFVTEPSLWFRSFGHVFQQVDMVLNPIRTLFVLVWSFGNTRAWNRALSMRCLVCMWKVVPSWVCWCDSTGRLSFWSCTTNQCPCLYRPFLCTIVQFKSCSLSNLWVCTVMIVNVVP